jgi:hypothetical protein
MKQSIPWELNWNRLDNHVKLIKIVIIATESTEEHERIRALQKIFLCSSVDSVAKNNSFSNVQKVTGRFMWRRFIRSC